MFLDAEVDGSNPRQYQSVVSLSKTLFPYYLNRLSWIMRIRREHPCEGCLLSAVSFEEK